MMRVVVLRPLALGDFLTGVPAYRAIARAYPHADRILAAPQTLAPLVPLVGAAFGRLHDTQPLAPLAPELHFADVAIDLHGKGPASQRILLASRPKKLVAFANDEVPASRGGATWYAGEPEVDRWCRMLAAAGIPADPSDLGLQRPAGTSPAAGATLVHPGAASAARRWPPDRWAEVVRAERRAGRRVLITGNAAEAVLAHEVAERAGLPRADVVAGRTTLTELAILVADAGRVLCGDTGVAHLATAYGTPSVVLFGPVSPREWGPPPSRERHIARWTGRRGDPHADVPDAGLLEIRVTDVLEDLRRLDRLAGRSA